MIFLKHCLLLACAAVTTTIEFDNQMDLGLNRVRGLSELPLTKLIQIKLSLAEDIALDNITSGDDLEGRAALALPMVSSLKGIDNKSIRRHGGWEEKGKDSKISKIFQLVKVWFQNRRMKWRHTREHGHLLNSEYKSTDQDIPKKMLKHDSKKCSETLQSCGDDEDIEIEVEL
ncbi:uncharacterized protein [Fopius arisanus]|uniref:Homeobox domain-containing protein n=1 Tax=Fopius arisanus TaxID=64838 RepID=A0A9R1TD67_9HYME|nr:PREDICTED: uncharacterized protein LOC105268832 [Fopius arisanus]